MKKLATLIAAEYKQFEDIYDLYDRYINKEKGIRAKMRDLSNNSSYIISIIHEIL